MLNGVDNVETRAGSFFEPVAGEQFDLVVANPPYVVSPETAYLFRDGGMRGDGVSELVVRGIPQRLAPRCVRVRPDRMGARPRRSDEARLVRGSRARVATRSCSTPRRTTRSRRRRSGIATSSTVPRPTPTHSTAGSPTTGSSGSSTSATPASCCASAPTAATIPQRAGSRRCSCRGRRSGRQDVTWRGSSRRMTACPGDAGRCAARPETARRGGGGRDAGHRFPAVGGAPRRRRSVSRRDCPSPPSSTQRPRALLAGLDGSRTLGQALASAVEGVDTREEGLQLARRMLEIGFLESSTTEDAPRRRATLQAPAPRTCDPAQDLALAGRESRRCFLARRVAAAVLAVREDEDSGRRLALDGDRDDPARAREQAVPERDVGVRLEPQGGSALREHRRTREEAGERRRCRTRSAARSTRERRAWSPPGESVCAATATGVGSNAARSAQATIRISPRYAAMRRRCGTRRA